MSEKTVRPFFYLRGLNNGTVETSIGDTESPDLKNMEFLRDGQAEKRRGYARIAALGEVPNPATQAVLVAVNVAGGTLAPGTTYVVTYTWRTFAGDTLEVESSSILLPGGSNAIQVTLPAFPTNSYKFAVNGPTITGDYGLSVISADIYACVQGGTLRFQYNTQTTVSNLTTLTAWAPNSDSLDLRPPSTRYALTGVTVTDLADTSFDTDLSAVAHYAGVTWVDATGRAYATSTSAGVAPTVAASLSAALKVTLPYFPTLVRDAGIPAVRLEYPVRYALIYMGTATTTLNLQGALKPYSAPSLAAMTGGALGANDWYAAWSYENADGEECFASLPGVVRVEGANNAFTVTVPKAPAKYMGLRVVRRWVYFGLGVGASLTRRAEVTTGDSLTITAANQGAAAVAPQPFWTLDRPLSGICPQKINRTSNAHCMGLTQFQLMGGGSGYIVVVFDDSIFRLSSDTSAGIVLKRLHAGISSRRRMSFATLNDLLFMANGEGATFGSTSRRYNIVYEARRDLIRRHGIDPPTAGPTVDATTLPGVLTFTVGRRYVYCFKNRYAPSRSPMYPADGSGSTGPITNRTVSLTALQVSTDNQVTDKEIYCTKDGGEYYFLLATIPNSQTSYLDNIPDNALPGASSTAPRVADFNVAVPPVFSVVHAYANRIWGAGDPASPTTVYFSNIPEAETGNLHQEIAPDEYDPLNTIDIETNNNDVPIALADYYNDLIVGLEDQSQKVSRGFSRRLVDQRKSPSSDGILGPGAWANSGSMLYFVSQRAIHAFAGDRPEPISDKVSGFFGLDESGFNLSGTARDYLQMVYYLAPGKDQIWTALSKGGNARNNCILVYHTQSGDWSLFSGIWYYPFECASLAVVEGAGGVNEVWSGNYHGEIFIHDRTGTDCGQFIEPDWWSKPLPLEGERHHHPSKLYVHVKQTGSYFAFVDYYRNYSKSQPVNDTSVPVSLAGASMTVWSPSSEQYRWNGTNNAGVKTVWNGKSGGFKRARVSMGGIGRGHRTRLRFFQEDIDPLEYRGTTWYTAMRKAHKVRNQRFIISAFTTLDHPSELSVGDG